MISIERGLRFHWTSKVFLLVIFVIFSCSRGSNVLRSPGVTLPEQKEVAIPSSKALDLQNQAVKLQSQLIVEGKLNELSRVFALYDEAIREAPDAHLFYATKAGLHLLLKQYPEASYTFAKAIQIRPHAAEYYMGNALALAGMGKEDFAKENCRFAIAAFNLQLKDRPKDPFARTNRALAAYLLEYRDIALRELEDILKEYPEHEAARILKNKIELSHEDDRWSLLGF